jgi:hypothetical protein
MEFSIRIKQFPFVHAVSTMSAAKSLAVSLTPAIIVRRLAGVIVVKPFSDFFCMINKSNNQRRMTDIWCMVLFQQSRIPSKLKIKNLYSCGRFQLLLRRVI